MNRRTGFTMVELLVVMVFIGALSSMAVPRFKEYKVRAYVSAMQSDLANLRIAEEEHLATNQQYSTDTSSLGLRFTTNVQVTITSKNIVGGYTAVATHVNAPDRRCITAMGPEAAPRESGAVTCEVTAGGSSAIPSTP